MTKEFVSYEQALALKELGFESPYPIGGFQGGKVFYYENNELYYDGRPMYSSDAHSGQLLAPLYQQAFRWFREKHELTSWVYNSHMDKFYYTILQDGRIVKSHDSTTTYEEAEIACLNKLIEIVKS